MLARSRIVVILDWKKKSRSLILTRENEAWGREKMARDGEKPPKISQLAVAGTGCMYFSSLPAFLNRGQNTPLQAPPWCLLMCPVRHLWRAAVSTDGESCPVLSRGCSSRLNSSGWLVFVPNYKEQLYKVTQTVIYLEEIMCSLWPDGIVADSNGFWTLTYGVTEFGFCFMSVGRVLKICLLVCCTFNTTHLQQGSFHSFSRFMTFI